MLRVTGLPPGRYTLYVDGDAVANANSARWAGGVALMDGPEFEQARRLRDEAVIKEKLFFYRWRAHNGEYIYGRRSKISDNYTDGRGNSGNPSFPAEMAELDRLLNAADRKLTELSKPNPHSYELVSDDSSEQ